jgi:hypothetical protein
MNRERKIYVKQHFANNIGKIAIDTSKVVLGSFVIGTIIKGGSDPTKLLLIGVGVFIFLVLLGIYLTMDKKKD